MHCAAETCTSESYGGKRLRDPSPPIYWGRKGEAKEGKETITRLMKTITRYSIALIAIDLLKEVVSWLRHTKCDCINRNLAYEQALAYEPALAYE